jgi:Protein of unknown function (DUF2568)
MTRQVSPLGSGSGRAPEAIFAFEHVSGAARLVCAGNLTLRFFVELAVFASLGYAGASVSGSPVARVVLASVLPVIAIVLWMWFLAPKATWRLGEPIAMVLEVAIFSAAAFALAISASEVLGAALGGVAVANGLLVRALPPRRRSSGSPVVTQLARP